VQHVALVMTVCLLLCVIDISAPLEKILSINVQKIFENYESNKTAQTAFSEAVAAAVKELQEMTNVIMKLQEEMNTLSKGVENAALLDSFCSKFKAKSEEKMETFRIQKRHFI
jgi:Skp family chaperone for outer membrane proteins